MKAIWEKYSKKWWTWAAVFVVVCIIIAPLMPKNERVLSEGSTTEPVADDSSSVEKPAENESASSNTGSEELESSEADKIIQAIKDEADYWQNVVLGELPELTAKKDNKATVAKLEEIIAKFDTDITFFMDASQAAGITPELSQACLDMKTALYGANSAALKPILAVFKGESTDDVPYGEMIESAQLSIDAAIKAVK